MLAKLRSIALSGIDAACVDVELDMSQGLPGVRIVGLPSNAVKEAADRVKSALRNSGYQHPNRKIVVNLAPAELKKEGATYDLPIALALLVASEQIPEERTHSYLVLGELALDGTVRPVRGALAATITARQQGIKGVVLPADNAPEAAVLADDVHIVPVRNVKDAVGFFAEGICPPIPTGEPDTHEALVLSYADISGQEHVKRACEVAAAGGHNLLMIGPPGSGKTMCAQRLPTILPPLTFAESLETTKIYSVAGALQAGQGLLSTRPFRSPHHSVSAPGLIGGGTVPRPGEVSLAHNGVLFLDEAPEFSRTILETLRQPLEDGVITISRASSTETYPAQVMLVIAMNGCPCGALGDPKRNCVCSPNQIAQYRGRLSGPLLDRIDIHVEVNAVTYDDLRSPGDGESSNVIAERVARARERQAARYPDRASPINATMTQKDFDDYTQLNAECESLLKAAMTEMGLSARAYKRILKVSRTIADLDQSPTIEMQHLSEAIQYRVLDRKQAY